MKETSANFISPNIWCCLASSVHNISKL